MYNKGHNFVTQSVAPTTRKQRKFASSTQKKSIDYVSQCSSFVRQRSPSAAAPVSVAVFKSERSLLLNTDYSCWSPPLVPPPTSWFYCLRCVCQDLLWECHLMKSYLNLFVGEQERRHQLIERKRSRWFIINKHVGYSKHNTQCNSPGEGRGRGERSKEEEKTEHWYVPWWMSGVLVADRSCLKSLNE